MIVIANRNVRSGRMSICGDAEESHVEIDRMSQRNVPPERANSVASAAETVSRAARQRNVASLDERRRRRQRSSRRHASPDGKIGRAETAVDRYGRCGQ